MGINQKVFIIWPYSYCGYCYNRTNSFNFTIIDRFLAKLKRFTIIYFSIFFNAKIKVSWNATIIPIKPFISRFSMQIFFPLEYFLFGTNVNINLTKYS